MKTSIALFAAAALLGCFGSVADAQPPEIVTQPTNQVVLAGGTASFSVAVSGIGPFTYQWQFNGTNLPNGVITTVAGNGSCGYSGDGGPATKAELSRPAGTAVDASGNLFIADTRNNRIRRVGTNGIITTVAGNGTSGFSGDGGRAADAELAGPIAVAVDASGNLLIADSGNNVIREVVLTGPTLVLNNISGANAGSYDVVVSSPYGSITSSVVSLVVALNPLNALSIGGQEVQLQFQGVPGSSCVLLSAANLTPPVDWRPVVTNVADANGNWTFTVANIVSEHAAFYKMSTAGQ